MEINVWNYAFEPPGPAFSESNDTKYNWNEISVAPVDLNNYPDKHEVLGAIVYFNGPFTNTSPIYANYKIYRNNIKFDEINQQIPTPASQGWEWWNWYKLKFWSGRASWEIYSPCNIRIEITLSGWVSGSATIYAEVIDSSLNLNQYFEIPSYSGPMPPASGFVIGFGDGFRYLVNYPGEYLVDWGWASETWAGKSIRISKGNDLWYYHIYDTNYMAITTPEPPEPPLPQPPSIEESINWEGNVSFGSHSFYLLSLYGINTNNTLGGFQIYNVTYKTANIFSPGQSRQDDLTTHNVSQYDCLTIIAENFDGSNITGIYDALIQNNVI